MKTQISSSAYGLVAVPPTPVALAAGQRLRDAQSHGIGCLPEPKRNSPRLLLSAAAFGIALVSTVMVAVSVRAISTPPVASQPFPH